MVSYWCAIVTLSLRQRMFLGNRYSTSKKMLWPWNLGQTSLKVIWTDTYRSATYDYLLTLRSNHGPISYRFRDKRRFHSKLANLAMYMRLATLSVRGGCKIITHLESQTSCPRFSARRSHSGALTSRFRLRLRVWVSYSIAGGLLHHTSDGSLASAFTIYDSWRLFADH